jgi:polyhydroxybutyrate depolymerase
MAEEIPRGHQKLSLEVGGRTREAILFLPNSYDKAKPIPLVIALHGMGGSALNALKETEWSVKAAKENFIVVYPEGTRPDGKKPPSLGRNPQAWNDGSGRFYAGEQKIDDVEFIRALIAKLRVEYTIDPKRIYVTGFSNGASMTSRLGAELSDQIAAIAPHSGACWNTNLKVKPGLSLLYITGTADTLNPLEGGFPKLALGGKDQGGEKKPPVQEQIDKWLTALACAKTPASDETKEGVRTRKYGPGETSTLEFITIDGLGHHWAGGKSQSPEFLVGKNTKKLNATDTVYEFFKKHPRP